QADETRLKQVLLNYISNAIKYNRLNGQVHIHYQPVTDSRLRISVTDTGYGLDDEQISKLFTSFERLNAASSDVEGTGIGLALNKRLVELMGGTVGVSSEKNVSSTFWLELNCQVQTTTEKQAQTPDNQPQVISEETKAAKTILYIEDNPANLRLVEGLIKSQTQYAFSSAIEPILGLELAYTQKPDLILLDINLPGLNGFEVLKYLRTNDATRHIPVIAISANAMPGDIETGRVAGFDAYITKPINLAKLISTINQQLADQ
ncbi:MAG TPA: response regulator, partial [Candidatus Tenderia electrophaga]|nr:response regulator [Candidatus Tenderia electrophaga]